MILRSLLSLARLASPAARTTTDSAGLDRRHTGRDPRGRPPTNLPRAGAARARDWRDRSINTEIIERAGGVNVADDGGRTQGLVQVSPEQVIVSDPEIVMTWVPTFYDWVWSDPLLAGVDAVRSGQVFLSPTTPFGWIDRPPSLNRMMGLRWMARLFYPEHWEGDLREETAQFYRTWCQVDLGDAELDRLLEWAEDRLPE